MLLQIATKKRPLLPPLLMNDTSNQGSNLSQQSGAPVIDWETKNKHKQMLAEQVAKILIKRGMEDIDEWYLHYLVYEVAKITPFLEVCPPGPQPVPLEEQSESAKSDLKVQGGGYSTGLSSEQPPSRLTLMAGIKVDSKSSPANSSPAKTGQSQNRCSGEFDDLRIEELQALMDNFKNLAKSEQVDLIQYMKRLETSNPEKVEQLKSSFSSAMQAASSGGSGADGNNDPRDGFGNAMLQVVERNIQRFGKESGAKNGNMDIRYLKRPYAKILIIKLVYLSSMIMLKTKRIVNGQTMQY